MTSNLIANVFNTYETRRHLVHTDTDERYQLHAQYRSGAGSLISREVCSSEIYRCAGFLSNSLSPGSVRIADTCSICLKEESQGVARIDGRSYVRLLTALFELRNISEFVRPAFNSLGSLHLRNIAERRRHESNNIFCS